MADIYQQIWDADQGDHGAGVKPVRAASAARPDPPKGFVEVSEVGTTSDHKQFPKVVHHRRSSYDKVAELCEIYRSEQKDLTLPNKQSSFIREVAGHPALDLAKKWLELNDTGKFSTSFNLHSQPDPVFKASTSFSKWENFLLAFWFRAAVEPIDSAPVVKPTTFESLIQTLIDTFDPSQDAPVGALLDDYAAQTGFPRDVFSQSPRKVLETLNNKLLSDTHKSNDLKLLDRFIRGALTAHNEVKKESSAFEHLFVGERKKSIQFDDGSFPLSGYHFWHAYFLDDGANDERDRVAFSDVSYESNVRAEGILTPEISVIQFSVEVEDATGTTWTLWKNTGSFFNGCSPAGLMAFAMVRFYGDPDEVGHATINQAEYKLRSHAQNHGTFIRTFFPVLVPSSTDASGSASAPPPAP